MRVKAHAVDGLFFCAEIATDFSALDASIVERGVVRPEMAIAAVPQGGHCVNVLEGWSSWICRQFGNPRLRAKMLVYSRQVEGSGWIKTSRLKLYLDVIEIESWI